MEKSRFRELISAVSIEEYERFGEFIHAAFFCRNVRVVRIWEYINSERREDSVYSVAELAGAAFGSEKYSAANFRMLLADFSQLIEQYLLHKEYEEDIRERDFKLLEITMKLKLRKGYNKYKRICTAHIDGAERRDMEFYYMQYLLESAKLITGDNGDFAAADDAITNALIAAKFENAVRAVKNAQKKPALLEELIEFVKRNERMFKKMHPLIYERMRELTSGSK